MTINMFVIPRIDRKRDNKLFIDNEVLEDNKSVDFDLILISYVHKIWTLLLPTREMYHSIFLNNYTNKLSYN